MWRRLLGRRYHSVKFDGICAVISNRRIFGWCQIKVQSHRRVVRVRRASVVPLKLKGTHTRLTVQALYAPGLKVEHSPSPSSQRCISVVLNLRLWDQQKHQFRTSLFSGKFSAANHQLRRHFLLLAPQPTYLSYLYPLQPSVRAL